MALANAEMYQEISLQIAQEAQRSGGLYAQDSRYAYQRRVDELSAAEAHALQTSQTSRIAQDAMQLRTGVQSPPIVNVPGNNG